MTANKTVYIAISSDILHKGQLNVIDVGAKLGDVTIGLLTDESIATYKRLPVIDWESRKALVEHLAEVKSVVAQHSLSYADNLRVLKPDYVIHGDDWRSGTQSMVRDEVVKILAEYGGELVEVPYTDGICGSDIERAMRPIINTTELRRAKLRRLLSLRPYIRAMEVSNGLSALIVENV